MGSPTQPHRRAKRPLAIVAGPYGHPFHPILVTVPIGAWVASLIFDLASRWTGDAEVFVKASFWLIAIGIVGAVIAAVFGFLDLLTLPRGTRTFTAGLAHMALNLTVVGLYAVGFAMRRGQLEQAPVALGPLALSLVALALLAISGWLGGTLTYRYGVRVVDERVQAEGFTS